MNWKKTHGKRALKNLFWRAVRATYLREYNEVLDEMKRENEKAYEDFVGRDTTKFCKVFINSSAVSDMILNNISETFNGYILEARGKHVIHMLEDIRTSLMERQHRKRTEISQHSHRICPNILDKLELIKRFSRHCIPHASSDVVFEVENYEDRFVVDISNRTCTCRAWDITGIPCIHACAAIHLLRRDASDFVHDCYSVEKYKLAYMHSLPPLNGDKMWPPAQGYPVVPPKAKKMPGRPKTKRRRSACEENPNNPSKLRKNGVQMTCQLCFQQGHNQRSCKNEPVVQPPKPKGKPGRPRKAPASDTTSTIATAKKKARRQKKAPTTAANLQSHTATHEGSSTVTQPTVNTSMGSAGKIFGRVPADKRPIFFPTRPQKAPKSRKIDKKTPTQESQS